MKKFRAITIICLSIIAILVVGNVWCMYGLYNTYKAKYLETVDNCVRQAYILSWIEVLHQRYDANNGKLTVSFTIVGDSTDTEWFDYPQLDRQLVEELASSFYAESVYGSGLMDANIGGLDSIFHRQLNFAGLRPEVAYILPADSTSSGGGSGLWKQPFYIDKYKHHLYDVYISSLGNEILRQMAGIIATSVAILLVMSFLIWYLFHWVSRLRSIEQMKDDFTHNMTHELKTPVTVAYSAADSMLRYYDQSDEERNKKFLGIILQRLSFLSGMIENILSMSMARFKTLELHKENVRVYPLLNDIAGMIESKADKPVTTVIDMHDDISVFTDPLHFGNLISNIMDNAVKYSGSEVEIRISGDDEKIVITDNGIGISKENIPHIFDKFYRVTNGDTYEVGGYGLGLFYVKQIGDLMGWRISVDSSLGKGTSFTINFKEDEKE